MHAQNTAQPAMGQVIELPSTTSRMIAAQDREARLTRAANDAEADMRAAARRLRTLSWAHDAIDAEHIADFEDIVALISARADLVARAVAAESPARPPRCGCAPHCDQDVANGYAEPWSEQ
ncbi:hypothetical protein ACXYTP_24000 [Tsukamurella ocularis]